MTMGWCSIAEANSFIYNLPLQLSSQTSPTLIWLTSFSSFIFLFSRWNSIKRTLAFLSICKTKLINCLKKILTQKLLVQLFLRSMLKLQQPLLCFTIDSNLDSKQYYWTPFVSSFVLVVLNLNNMSVMSLTVTTNIFIYLWWPDAKREVTSVFI